MSAGIDEAALALLPEHKRELARLLLAARAPARDAVPAQPVPRREDAPVPATPTQARLWRYAQAGDAAAGTGSHAVRLRGPLDPGALTGALTAVIGRHEALRTGLGEGPDGLRQHVAAEPHLRLRVLDLSGTPHQDQAAQVTRQVHASAGRPLDIASGEGTRFTLIKLREDEHVLILAAHLAVFDGWSSGVFLHDLAAAYRGETRAAPALQLGDYAVWQRGWLDGPHGAAELGHWRTALAGVPAAPAHDGFTRGHLPVGLDPEVTDAGIAVGASHGATPFMTLLGALALVLARSRGNPDVVIGTPTAGRVFPGMEDMVGQFTTVVPIRVDCSGRPTFAGLLRRVRTAVADALAHGRLPVDTLARELRGTPYSVLFALHNYPVVPLDLPGIEVGQVTGPPARHLELYSPDPRTAEACIGLVERKGRIGGTAEHNRNAMTADQVRALVDGVGEILALAAAEPTTTYPC
ncbi:condensation domain-containing protein [Rhizohabitans arisaemae]|uniref:condensation domain-containing protein n=1 Tax=Rhizohabitans arisaemae TaxID=2720610 RepID=UPI0024B0434C|nr:condensation domain-containing protein [Rhizohabitans arisaemae]